MSSSPFHHVALRFWQRYGLRLTHAEYKRLCAAITTGGVTLKFLKGCGDARSIALIRVYDRDVVIVWDAETKVIVTALPVTYAPRDERFFRTGKRRKWRDRRAYSRSWSWEDE